MKRSVNSALMGMALSAGLSLQPVVAQSGGSAYPNLNIGSNFNSMGELRQPETDSG